MRLVLFDFLMRLDCYKERLHLKFLRRRHKPFPDISVSVNLLKTVRARKHNLILLIFLEEIRRRGAKALDQIHQRHDRRRNLSPLQLGDKAFGQLRPIRELLLRKPVPVSQILDFSSDFRIYRFGFHRHPLLNFLYCITKHTPYCIILSLNIMSIIKITPGRRGHGVAGERSGRV